MFTDTDTTPHRPRRALIYGGTSGLGFATALDLSSRGWELGLVARHPGRSAEWPGGAGRKPAYYSADVNDAAAVLAVTRAFVAGGPLDALVYSAGSALFTPVEETTDEIWAQMLGANLTGLFHAVRSALPTLRGARGGHIVGILSIASRHAFGNSSAYTAAKHGALGFLDSVRVEARGDGVHVTAVLPGAIDTPLWDRLGSAWDRTRMMEAAEVARVLADLLEGRSTGMVEELRIGPVGGAL